VYFNLSFPQIAEYAYRFGMGGWLELTQQGLSPCKKYKTSWRSLVFSF